MNRRIRTTATMRSPLASTMSVELGGDRWRIFWGLMPLPGNARVIGVVAINGLGWGALLLMPAGIYMQGNGGVCSSLDQSLVRDALSKARAGSHGGAGRGAGRKVADGATGLRRRNITIDDGSAERLKALGDGDLSLGIRRAADLL